ncbi:MAG TPA: hypothetical protein ENK23_05070 [Sorangium sp.]|nr:hypothetical protein [Sorangium sp.]
MSLLRRFDDDERFDFEGVRRFERRICECLDAVVALGQPFQTSAEPGVPFAGVDVLAEAVQYGRDALTADPARAFARTFVLTSIAGEDTVRAALLALKQSPPYTYRAQAEAFVLSPNKALGPALRKLARDDDPLVAGLALDTLARRDEVEIGVVLPLVEHPVEEVRLGAIAALGRAKEHRAAAQILIDICDQELDDDIFVEAVEGLITLGYRAGLTRLRERLDEEEAERGVLPEQLRMRCMQLLGMAGNAGDYARLLQLYYGDVGQALALGFHGHPALVAELIAALDSSREGGLYLGRRGMRDAARALFRITGAPLFQERPSGQDPYDIVTDQRVWLDWWGSNEERFEPTVRYRYGKPFSLLSSVEELARDRAPFGVRAACARELSLYDLPERVSVTAFVRDQEQKLSVLRDFLTNDVVAADPKFAPGRWLTLLR